MKVNHRVVFETEERQTFEAMCLGLYVAFPDPKTEGHKRGDRNPDAQAHSSLGRLTNRNEEWSHRQLVEARGFLEHMVEVLTAEADPEHWRAMMPALLSPLPAPPAGLGVLRVPLIADPQAMIDVIVPARKAFLESAEESLKLVVRALSFAVDVPDEKWRDC